MLKITAEMKEARDGQESGPKSLLGTSTSISMDVKTERVRVVNDGESFYFPSPSFSGFSHFLKKHFFLLFVKMLKRC